MSFARLTMRLFDQCQLSNQTQITYSDISYIEKRQSILPSYDWRSNLSKFFVTQKSNMHMNYIYDTPYRQDQAKSIKLLSKAIRVTHTVQPLDTVSFSQEILTQPEFLIETLWYCSQKNLMLIETKETYQEDSYDLLPSWFRNLQTFTLQEWITAHFEVRLRYCYQSIKSGDIFRDSQRIHAQEYSKIWKMMGKQRKKKLLQKIMEIFAQMPEDFFHTFGRKQETDQSTPEGQATVRILYNLSSCKGKDVNAIKEMIKQRLKNLDEQSQYSIQPDHFIYECLEWRLMAPIDPTLYFKGLIIFELEKLRYINLFENEPADEGKKKKKKKKLKKK